MPVLPILAGAIDVCALGAFIAATEKQDDLFTVVRIVDAISRSKIDSHLPNTVAAELAIAEIAEFHAEDPPVDGNSSFDIADLCSHSVTTTRPFDVLYRRISYMVNLRLKTN